MLDQTPQKEDFNISMMLPSRNNLKTSFYSFFAQSTTNCNVGPSINDVTIFSWLLPFFLLCHCLQCWASQKYTNKTVMIIGGFVFEWYYHFVWLLTPPSPISLLLYFYASWICTSRYIIHYHLKVQANPSKNGTKKKQW